MKKQKILSLLFMMMVSGLTLVKGQSVQSLTPSVPTSPQAEAFKRYGEYAVNHSTGIPDISIPLYEINHRGYKIPLVLKYNPQPLKPGYNYDVYGHGWGLSVNSAVSRSIEGAPDEWSAFRLETEKLNYYYYSSPVGALECIESPGCNLALQPHYDLFASNFTHDKFNVVLPNGTSFNFIIDQGENNGPAFTVSEGRKVIMDCSYSPSNINSFTIIDEDGVKYTFEGADTPYGGMFTIHGSSYVSWQLTRIDLPYSTEPITFTYDYSIQSEYGIACKEHGIRITSSNLKAEAQDAPIAQPYYYKMKLLSSISYGSSRISLIYKDQSQVNGYGGPPYNYVNGIQVYEHTSLIRDIRLDMTIYDVASSCTASKLAKLDSVSIRGSNLTAAPQVFTCTYRIPNYQLFKGTDHWGYLSYSDTEYDLANFNIFVGFEPDYYHLFYYTKISAVTKSPQDINPYYKLKLSRSNYDNRRPSGDHDALILLRYPTGGHTDFIWESHKFLTSTDYNGNYILDPQNRIPANAPGVRIRKITNYTKDGVVADVKNYRYGKTNIEAYTPDQFNYIYAVESPNAHTGLGEAVVDPNILTYMNYSKDIHGYTSNIYGYSLYLIRNMILGLNPNGEYTSFVNPFMDNDLGLWECFFSASNFRRILNGRPAVLYPEVTVYHGEIDENSQYTPEKTIGKTVYKYDVTEMGPDLLGKFIYDAFIEAPRYFLHTIDYIPQPYRYNKLEEQSDYKFDGQGYKLVKKENYNWTAHTQYFSEFSYSSPYHPSVIPPYITLANLFRSKIDVHGVSLLESKLSTLYSPNKDSIVSSENFTYNNWNQLSSIVYTNSAGKTVEKAFSYPQDKSGDIILKMIKKNIVSPVLESKTKIYEAYQNPIETSGSKIDYKEYTIGGSTIIMPSQSYELEIKPSSSEYVLRNELNSYSVNGNPLEFVSKDGIRSAYIWGYNDRYMIAEAKNASAGEIAYSSFEDATKGNWSYTGTVSTSSAGTFVPTGRKYYNLTSTTGLDKTVTNGKTYIVSYWRNATSPYTVTGGTGTVTTGATVNGWTYFEHKITANNSVIYISGSGGIDEVRLYPVDAFMTTYTYDPLIGITSQADANGRTSYYEYDSFGRLQVIKDKDGNILKTVDYHYKQ